MGESRKSKRVSWATDVNLCQVRLFLSEDSPSQVGKGTQDHLQAKPFRSIGGSVGPDDNLPPGFEGVHTAYSWSTKLSQIPLTKWRCPPRFIMTIDWQVVAGEESKEIETQSQREMRVLEAIYPRASAIPPNPSALPGIHEPTGDDQQHAPVIPITPMEDEDIPLAHTAASSSGGVDHDILSAAGAALAAAISSGADNSTNHVNLIDHALLVKIFSDPKTIDHLTTSHRLNSQNAPPPPHHLLSGRCDPLAASGPHYPARAGPGPGPHLPVQRDSSYFKSLIQQHGLERRGSGAGPPPPGQHEHHMVGPAAKAKVMKPCIYFNSPKGCRNGAECSFQHVASGGRRRPSGAAAGGPDAKRAKLESEITSL